MLVMVEWSVGQWVVGAMSFQKIYCLHSEYCPKVKKWSDWMSCKL